MMHQIQRFSLSLRKSQFTLSVRWKPVFAPTIVWTVWFYKASLKYFFPVCLSLTVSMINVSKLWVQPAPSLLPFFHSSWATSTKPARVYDTASLPFAPPGKKCQFHTAPLSTMSYNAFYQALHNLTLFKRQLHYFNVHHYTKRIRSSVQPEHSSNLATKLLRATRVGSSLRDVLDSETPSQVSAKNFKYQKRLHIFIVLTTATQPRRYIHTN